MSKKPEAHLRIFAKRSELVNEIGQMEVFHEGPLEPDSKSRAAKIDGSLKNGYLRKIILACKAGENLDFSNLSSEKTSYLSNLVEKVNANEGRALVGLAILQLTIKAIEPNQNIRLHKGGDNSNHFSWTNGISMRSIDNTYITPILREFQLLSLNADGIMMTRSLAENYPYSQLYKAQLKGPRTEWMSLVEDIESKNIDPQQALKFLISKLINRTNEFNVLVEQLISAAKKTVASKDFDLTLLLKIFKSHIEKSNHAARVMEVQMHTFMQALVMLGVVDFRLGNLSQMRNANKKHGNIGDVELYDGRNIVEAWDSKFGKSYFRDELEELSEKIETHTKLKVAGFVSNMPIERMAELKGRISELEQEYGVKVFLLTFDEWINFQINSYAPRGTLNSRELASNWLKAYVETLGLKRTEIAPIDEPCQQWVSSLFDILK